MTVQGLLGREEAVRLPGRESGEIPRQAFLADIRGELCCCGVVGTTGQQCCGIILLSASVLTCPCPVFIVSTVCEEQFRVCQKSHSVRRYACLAELN